MIRPLLSSSFIAALLRIFILNFLYLLPDPLFAFNSFYFPPPLFPSYCFLIFFLIPLSSKTVLILLFSASLSTTASIRNRQRKHKTYISNYLNLSAYPSQPPTYPQSRMFFCFQIQTLLSLTFPSLSNPLLLPNSLFSTLNLSILILPLV